MIFSPPSPPPGPLSNWLTSLVEATRRALLPLISKNEATPHVLFQSPDETVSALTTDDDGYLVLTPMGGTGERFARDGEVAANLAAGLAAMDADHNADLAAAIAALPAYTAGTWTPAFSFSGNAVGLTHGSRSGRYVRHGNLVTAWADIALTAKGSSVGNARIAGLPFEAATQAAVAIGFCTGMVASHGLQGAVINAGNTYLELTGRTSTGIVTGGAAETQFTNTSRVVVSITYEAVP